MMNSLRSVCSQAHVITLKKNGESLTMITLNCPDCGKEYSLSDEMAGKKASCECGAILFVPKTITAPEGMKTCPNCNKISEEKSILCTSCGYNFNTGGRVKSATTSVEADENPKLLLIIKMIKPAIFAIISLIILYIVYSTFFAKNYGVSSSSPLGTFQSIEKHLLKYGYEQEPDNSDKLPKVFEKGCKKIEWKDVKLAKLSQGMYVEKVFVIVSPEKEVLAIGAKFKGGVKSIPGDTGSMSGRFLSSFWKEVGFLSPPEYKEVVKGEGRWSYTFNKANETVNEISGEWIEYPEEITILPSSHTIIMSYTRFKDLSYTQIQQGYFQDTAIDVEEIKE